MAGYHFGNSEVVHRIMSTKNIAVRHYLVGGRLLQAKRGGRNIGERLNSHQYGTRGINLTIRQPLRCTKWRGQFFSIEGDGC